MTASADHYREKAVLRYTAAQEVDDSAQRAAFLDLALAYLGLAEMAERNELTQVRERAPAAGQDGHAGG
jgi:hypothetical protein